MDMQKFILFIFAVQKSGKWGTFFPSTLYLDFLAYNKNFALDFGNHFCFSLMSHEASGVPSTKFWGGQNV